MQEARPCVEVQNVTAAQAGGSIRLTGQVRVGMDLPLLVGLTAELTGHHFAFDAGTRSGNVVSRRYEEQRLLASWHAATEAGSAACILPFTAQLRLPGDAPGHRTTWEVVLRPRIGSPGMETEGKSLTVWTSRPPGGAPWSGFFEEERATSREVAPGVILHQIGGRLPTGPVRLHLVEVDTAHPAVHVDALLAQTTYLNDDAQWPRQPVSALVARAGAVVGVNANFFEMNATHNPRGTHVSGGRLVKSHNAKWHAAFFVSHAGTPHFGKVHWAGGVRRPGSIGLQPVAGLNMTTAGPDAITLFRSPWRRSPGLPVGSGERVVELVVGGVTQIAGTGAAYRIDGVWGEAVWLEGVIKEVRIGREGVPLSPSVLVVSGRGEGAGFLLDAFSVGDRIEIGFGLGGECYWPALASWRQIRACVCGNVMLLHNGGYGDETVFTDHLLHPRTFVATTASGDRLFLAAADGRSEESAGLTYRQAADFLLYLGAFHGLNLDGGGSTTLVIREPGSAAVQVVNRPSDGAERPVPDGLAVFCRERC